MLKSNGIEVKNVREDSRYLSTSMHYEFELRDMDKFIEFTSQYSNLQLPPYASRLLNSTIVGADLEYSNIPLTQALSLDIYPLSLSTEIMNDMKKTDESFYNYIKNFISKKGILYHINYNIVSEDFDGFIKDISENHTLKNSSKLLVNILGTSFSGNGSLIAPELLQTDAQKIMIKVLNAREEMSINLSEFSSRSTFETRTTYNSFVKLKSISLNTKDISAGDSSVNISDLALNISSTTQANKAQLNSKSSCSNINIDSKIFNLNLSNFNYEIDMSDIDKDSLEEFIVLLSKLRTNNSARVFTKIKDTTLNMLSKGIKLDIKDLSLKNIKLNGDDLKGLSIKSTMILKEDKYLAKKIYYGPLFIAQNLDINFNFKLSKKMFSKIASVTPMAIFTQRYAKSSGDDLIFDFTFIKGEFKVNSKAPIK